MWKKFWSFSTIVEKKIWKRTMFPIQVRMRLLTFPCQDAEYFQWLDSYPDTERVNPCIPTRIHYIGFFLNLIITSLFWSFYHYLFYDTGETGLWRRPENFVSPMRWSAPESRKAWNRSHAKRHAAHKVWAWQLRPALHNRLGSCYPSWWFIFKFIFNFSSAL